MEEKKKTGRPKKEIDQNLFKKLCGIFCTLEEIAGMFDCSEDTIERWCKRTYGETLGKISLRRSQFRLAEKSAAMAIFLGKNYLGQTDRTEQIVSNVEDLQPLSEMLKYESTND